MSSRRSPSFYHGGSLIESFKKYNGTKHTRTFICWNQVLCMVFGQLTNRDSLRDLIVALDAHKAKSYHLGLGALVAGKKHHKDTKSLRFHKAKSIIILN
jgi:hypothetical protein